MKRKLGITILPPAAAAGARARTKRVLRRLALVVALGAALLVPAAVASGAAGAPKCTAAHGQALIDQGAYKQAVLEFGCVIQAQPTEVEGYRGRSEAELLLGRFSAAYADYARVTAYVKPVHPDAEQTILAEYADRLGATPGDVAALTGASFARWVFFDYAQAVQLLNTLLALRPDDVYGTLFRGSSRVLKSGPDAQGAAELERAIALAPDSPDVRFIVADAYTYGQPQPLRALAEASLALEWGLDTPRVHAILAAAYASLGDAAAAAEHIDRHIDLVTTQLVATSPLPRGGSLALDLVAGRTYEIPVTVAAGETIAVATSSKDFYDTIAVLLGPDGTPVAGSDDENLYFAAIDHVAATGGTYRVRVTSFEGIDTGVLAVKRS